MMNTRHPILNPILSSTHEPRAFRVPRPRARITLTTTLLLAALCTMSACRTSNREATLRDIQAMRQAELRDAREAQNLVLQAQRLEDTKQFDRAIEAYQQAIQTYRETPAAWNNLGRLLMDKGDGSTAAEAFRVAADLSPSDPKPMHNLGVLYESFDWPDDALHYYAQALERNKHYLPSLRRSVMLEVTMSRVTDQTRERLRRALFLEKDRNWRALLLRAQLRIENESLDLQPTEPESSSIIMPPPSRDQVASPHSPEPDSAFPAPSAETAPWTDEPPMEDLPPADADNSDLIPPPPPSDDMPPASDAPSEQTPSEP